MKVEEVRTGTGAVDGPDIGWNAGGKLCSQEDRGGSRLKSQR